MKPCTLISSISGYVQGNYLTLGTQSLIFDLLIKNKFQLSYNLMFSSITHFIPNANGSVQHVLPFHLNRIFLNCSYKAQLSFSSILVEPESIG